MVHQQRKILSDEHVQPGGEAGGTAPVFAPRLDILGVRTEFPWVASRSGELSAWLQYELRADILGGLRAWL